MRKDQLVKALSRAGKSKPTSKAKLARNGVALKSHSSAKNGKASDPRAHINGKSSHGKPGPGKPTVSKVSRVHINGSAKLNGTAKLNGKHVVPSKSGKTLPQPARNPRATQRIQKVHAERERLKDLSLRPSSRKSAAPLKDRLVLMVRDSFWLHAVWTVTPLSVKRAEAALAEHWHTARPYLRLLEVDTGHTTSASERVVREVEIHAGVTNWYIDVANPPHSYRVEIGYRAVSGKFFPIARSNSVTTPAPGTSDTIDENWTDIAANYEKIYALSGGYSEEHFSGDLQELFEERLQRPMGNGSSSFGSGAERILNRHRDFEFHVDAEMILFGHTKPDARVTLGGEPVKLRPDGSFTIRLSMPDKRQVLPVVASSPDGVEQRTVVIAIERNTKVLEPMTREVNEQ